MTISDRAGAGGIHQSREILLTNRSWVEVLGVEVPPSWAGGIVHVGGRIIQTEGEASNADGDAYDGTYQFAYVDLRVVGYLGGHPTTIARTVLGRDGCPIEVELPERRMYQRLAVQGRLVLDGHLWDFQSGNAFDGFVNIEPRPANPPTASVSATVRFLRRGA